MKKEKKTFNDLNFREQTFINNYIELGVATDAARKAGYKHPEKIGSVLLARLQGIIEQRIASTAGYKKTIMTQIEVLEKYTAIARGEIPEEVLLVVDGNIVRELKKTSVKDRLKALDALARRYGLDKKMITNEMKIQIINDLTSDIEEDKENETIE